MATITSTMSLSAFPLSFYDVPTASLAIFSTQLGKHQKRALSKPYPCTISRSNLSVDIKDKADYLRHWFPNVIHTVKTPTHWRDLYLYFDGHDLFVEGAIFCFYVINQIAGDNTVFVMNANIEIENFAAQWVVANEGKIFSVPPHYPILALFSEDDSANMQDMRPEECAFLFEALNRYRHERLKKVRTRPVRPFQPILDHSPRFRPHPLFIPGTAVDPQGVPIPNRDPQQNDRFAEHKRNLNGPPQSNLRNELHRDAGNRTYSNEITTNSRGPPRSNSNQNTSRAHISNPVDVTPPAQVTSEEPIYVLNSQCSSPSRGQLTPKHKRLFSVSSTYRSKYNHDSRRITSSESESVVQKSGSDGRSLPSESPKADLRFSQGAQCGSSSEYLNGGQRFSQDARRIPFAGHPQAIIAAHNGVCTFFYSGEPRFIGLAVEQTGRTAYVFGVEQSLFESHTLKDMMSNCGKVETISWLPGRGSTGSAFVAFKETSSVQSAIDRFDGHVLQPSGQTISVSVPLNYRDRSNGRGYQNSCYDSRPRGPSLRKQSISYIPHAYSNSQSRSQSPVRFPLTVGFQAQLTSSASELAQHAAALDRIIAKGPLESVDLNSKSKLDGQISTQSHNPTSNNKENSPTKTYEKDGIQACASGKGKKKVGKPNSTRPTPTVTPTKSRSELNLTLSKSELRSDNSTEESKRKPYNGGTKKKKPKYSAKNELESSFNNVLFASRYSDEATSPTGTENTQYSASKSTNTSLSTVSSRKPSVASFTGNSEVGTPMPSKADASPSNSITPTNIKSISHSHNEIFSGSDCVTNSTVVSRNRILELQQDGNDNSESSNTTRSFRKADLKAARNAKHSTEAATGQEDFNRDSSEQPKENVPINLDDREQFPSLSVPKSPTSTIADGKRPPPIVNSFRLPPPFMGPLNQRNASGNIKTQKPVVAVPRIKSGPKANEVPLVHSTVPSEAGECAESECDDDCLRMKLGKLGKLDSTVLLQNEPSNHTDLGSRQWPFVKKFRGK